MERYFVEPYEFIPPFRSTFWCRIAMLFLPSHLQGRLGVHKTRIEGLHHLQEATRAGAGILVAPNHCRWADPMVLGAAAGNEGHFLYYMASYHLFKQGGLTSWLMRRLGGFSVWREGTDREAIRAAAGILAEGERPLCLFPEGTWLRQNDRVLPLQEGLSLILRQAARQSERPLVVLPVGIKYWMLADPRPAASQRLAPLERGLGWASQAHLPLVTRIERLGSALLALREVELLGSPQPGSLDARLAHLVETQLHRLEAQHLGKAQAGWALERTRRVRQVLARRLLQEKDNRAEVQAIRRDLAVLLLCENLTGHSLAYLQEAPTPERLVETVQRIEETVKDRYETPLVPMGVTVRFGEPLDARAVLAGKAGKGERGSDPLVSRLRPAMQGLLDAINAAGPPPEWNCPRPPLPPAIIPSPLQG